MKKIVVSLSVLILLPIAFVMGCSNNSTPSGAGGAVGTGGSTSSTATPTVTLTTTGTQTPSATPTPQVSQAMVNLGAAADYAALAYSGITNSGASTLCGNLGLYPKSSVGGGIVIQCTGIRNVDNSAADTAKLNLGTAYTDAMGRSGGATLPPGADIGGETLYPGLYFETGNLNLSSADLTLDALGDSSAVFIFQVQGDLIAGPGRKVVLMGDAQAANVFWAVAGYAALNTTVSFAGTIMAHTSVTLNTGAVLQGRALAETGNVTLLSNTITDPTP